MSNLRSNPSNLTIVALVVILLATFAAPTPAQAAQPSGGKFLYLRDEAKCVSQQTPPAEYPLPDALPNCNIPQTLVVAGADGRIMREVRLPAHVTSYAFSPDGAWMAYHTGEASGCEKDELTKADLALNLLNTQTGESKLVAKLLRVDFLQKIEELLPFMPTDLTLDQARGWACETLLDGIFKMAWSPNGKYVAFSGQIDGPSSDLYVFDVSSVELRRLSDGPENIQELVWSPDSLWIEHEALLVNGEGVIPNLYFASVDGSAMKSRGNLEMFIRWLDNTSYQVGKCINGAGCISFDKVNLFTGKRESLLKESLKQEGSGMNVYNPQTHVLAIRVESRGSVALVNLLSLKTYWVEGCEGKVLYRDSNMQKTFSTRGCEDIVLICKGDIDFVIRSDDDTPIKLALRNNVIKYMPNSITRAIDQSLFYHPALDGISPDGKYIVIPKEDGLYVYRLSDGLFTRFIKMELPQLPIKDDYKAGVKFLWVSQNTTFVKVTMPGGVTSQLYALDFLRGQPKLVDEGVISGEMVVGGR